MSSPDDPLPVDEGGNTRRPPVSYDTSLLADRSSTGSIIRARYSLKSFNDVEDSFRIVETTARKELEKRQVDERPQFFLSSANEEWILLEKPLAKQSRNRMKRSYWLTRVVRKNPSTL